MNKWISVDKRLPEDNKLKIIRYADEWKGVESFLGIKLDRYSISSNMDRRIWGLQFSSPRLRVTHWANLPEGYEQ